MLTKAVTDYGCADNLGSAAWLLNRPTPLLQATLIQHIIEITQER
jgi:hypothetical protein